MHSQDGKLGDGAKHGKVELQKHHTQGEVLSQQMGPTLEDLEDPWIRDL